MNFAAIDFETANSLLGSACSAGLVKVAGETIVEQAVYLIRPPPRQFLFTYIHGLTWRHVETANDFETLWPEVRRFLAGAEFLAAHNASFDKKVLHACCDRHDIPRPSPPFRCAVQLSRKVWDIRPTKLPDVCRKLGIELNHHEALSDAKACARIVVAANKAVQTKTSEPAPAKRRVAVTAVARVSRSRALVSGQA
jgi:DNA polymerase-3 subunit epsilon